MGVYDYDNDHELIGLRGWDVAVRPDHRRKGLASAMYRYAEQAFGLPISKGSFQTPAGSGFVQGRK